MNEKQEDIRPYLEIAERGTGEIVEKKSRFIATVAPVWSEEEALHFIEEIKKKYWDARHNCTAYIIGRKSELVRYSDDGEPQGTAGKPMLEVLNGAGLTNIAVVVTRYFGGTLLGTGGLVRAYTQAVQEGIKNTSVMRMRYGSALTIRAEYPEVGKIQYLLGQRNIPILQSRYEEKVEMDIMLPFEDTEDIKKAVTEVTAAKAAAEVTGAGFYKDFTLTNR